MAASQTRQSPSPTSALPPRAAYERWAPSYGQSGRNPVSDAAALALESLLPPMVGRCVLDLACGDGRWAGEAQAAGAGTILGLDFSGGMLKAARKRMPGLALAAGEMRHLPLAGASLDLIILALALGHAPDPAPVLREIARCLMPGGQLALVDLHPNWQRLGWQRGFRDAAGRRFTVAWHPHAPESVAAAARRAGLEPIAQVERGLEVARDAGPYADPGPADSAIGIHGDRAIVYAMLVTKRR
jgi:malonyl-CoA O-methyltransferase